VNVVENSRDLKENDTNADNNIDMIEQCPPEKDIHKLVMKIPTIGSTSF
jgi:hypothetical protein